jgi:hypothetical protein
VPTLAAALVWLGALYAKAELPDAATLLADLGLNTEEIAKVQAGKLVRYAVQPASERELVAGLAFQVPISPRELVNESKTDLLDLVDPSMIAYGVVPGDESLADFVQLPLGPDARERARAYVNAAPGGVLNLSAEEIAAFRKLAGAVPSVVETQVRNALLARLSAYRARGLAGIAPYARGDGERSPADEIRTACRAAKVLEKYAPAAYQLLLSYPDAKPRGMEETFRWALFDADGTPTIALSHLMLVPDGDAWIVLERQFYVSTGYNSGQAVAAFLPSEAGTVVIYANRTSTDQITGIGGRAKRSIGSKALASQLETLFERARAAVKPNPQNPAE